MKNLYSLIRAYFQAVVDEWNDILFEINHTTPEMIYKRNTTKRISNAMIDAILDHAETWADTDDGWIIPDYYEELCKIASRPNEIKARAQAELDKQAKEPMSTEHAMDAVPYILGGFSCLRSTLENTEEGK